ncbi:hypothetical protein LMG32879_002318 [Brytella acorum]|uniref:Uncharacterized protein n=2 Tax=Brytella acorum TaxID=2959299 RepID=A0AA35USP2_9PROT|nr:hypothetical protein [Brytella acorum]CAI9121471.1 hypothetical protein LMG32879_002318 [Brytella acorum]
MPDLRIQWRYGHEPCGDFRRRLVELANGASGIAQYGSADSPIEYFVADNAHARVMNLTVASYTVTQIVLKTALTAAQMARIHHGMYVITNSIDTTLTAPAFSAAAPLPAPNYYASIVDYVADSTHIAVSGWAVPNAGNGASGQVPSVSNLDIAWTNFGVPTVGIGAATNTSAINWVMNYTTTNSWLNNYENEIDILGNPGFAPGRMRIRGLTMTYQGPVPSADSWALNLNTIALPVQLHMEVNPTGYGIQSNEFITKGNSGVNELGDMWEIQESAAFADAAQNMRLVSWLAQDCATAGYGCVSVHQGLIVNGSQGTVSGQTPQAQIVYDPLLPGHPTNSTGVLGLASFGGIDFSLDGGHPTVPQGNYMAFQPSTWTASNPTAPILQAASPSQLNVRDNGGNGITLDTWKLNVGSTAIAAQFQEALSTPSSSSAQCTAGQFSDDTNYHYVCVAANTWKRVALSAF